MERRNFIKTMGVACISSAISSAGCLIEQQSELHTQRKLELMGMQTPDLDGSLGLLKKVAEAFLEMKQDAARSRIYLRPRSTYRSFDEQLRIWNAAYTYYDNLGMGPWTIIEKITKNIAIPKTSRHHFGTDLDIDITDGNKNYKAYGWLKNNGGRYGFYEVYVDDPWRTGFEHEPWHWSYRELSVPILREFLSINLIKELRDHRILGSEYFSSNFIRDYREKWVLGINPLLIPS